MGSPGRLLPGTWVRGKWTGERFLIERLLGSGANGEVYLVRTRKGRAAMKVCQQAGDVALEWSVLDAIRGQPAFPQPMLIDDADGEALYFYIMEWIPGRPLPERLRPADQREFAWAVEQIALGLLPLHRQGYAFCDLKPQNILLCDGLQPPVRFVDVGGVTAFGRSVRQFTPLVDRAFWGAGTRESDAGYDLCALALWGVCAFAAPDLQTLAAERPEQRRRWLERALRHFPLPAFVPVLAETLAGQIHTADEFLTAWRTTTVRGARKRAGLGMSMTSTPFTRASSTRASAARTGASAQSASGLGPTGSPPTATAAGARRGDWTDWVMWGSVGALATVAALAWGTFLHWF